MQAQTVIPVLWNSKYYYSNGERKVLYKPKHASNYIFSVEADNQRWFRDQLGATFTLSTPRLFTSLRVFDDIIDEANSDYPRGQACGLNIWKIIMEEVKVYLNICRPDWTIMLYTFTPPMPEGDQSLSGLGGMVGKENFGCSYARPGVSADSGHKPFLACNYTAEQLISLGYSFPMWSAEWGAIAGGYAHEKVHCWTDLPHTENDPNTQVDERYESILFAYWDYPNVGFLPNEAQALLESGALS